DREVADDVLPAPAAAVVHAVQVRLDVHLGVRRPVFRGAEVHAGLLDAVALDVLVLHPAPGAFDLLTVVDGDVELLLRGGAVGHRAGERHHDRRGDAHLGPVGDLNVGSHRLVRVHGGDGAVERLGGAAGVDCLARDRV